MGRHEVVAADTHALLWWLNDPRQLSIAAREAMEDAGRVSFAAITVWEIAFLSQRRRIQIANVERWLTDLIALPQVDLAPLTVAIAVRAAALPDPIRDPADRLIVATALERRVPLVTKDERIHRAAAVEAIW